jgi:hypothetical protein
VSFKGPKGETIAREGNFQNFSPYIMTTNNNNNEPIITTGILVLIG